MLRPFKPHLMLLASLVATGSLHADVETKSTPPKAAVTSMKPEELAGFDQQPREVRELITAALKLTERNLTYTYGSSNPDNGGMDCSGTIYHVLRGQKISTVPRQSDHICGWVMKKSTFTRTKDVHSFDHEIFAALQPGDLVFWSGTYEAGQREIPVTHVMMYLGKRASDGKPLVFGASNGRSYEGQKRCGVSVFNFKVPTAKSSSALYGFGPIPGLRPKEKMPLFATIKAALMPDKKPVSTETDSPAVQEEIRKAALPTDDVTPASTTGKEESE